MYNVSEQHYISEILKLGSRERAVTYFSENELTQEKFK